MTEEFIKHLENITVKSGSYHDKSLSESVAFFLNEAKAGNSIGQAIEDLIDIYSKCNNSDMIHKITLAVLTESIRQNKVYDIESSAAYTSYGPTAYSMVLTTLVCQGEDIKPLFERYTIIALKETHFYHQSIFYNYIHNKIKPRPDEAVELCEWLKKNSQTFPDAVKIIYDILKVDHKKDCVRILASFIDDQINIDKAFELLNEFILDYSDFLSSYSEIAFDKLEIEQYSLGCTMFFLSISIRNNQFESVVRLFQHPNQYAVGRILYLIPNYYVGNEEFILKTIEYLIFSLKNYNEIWWDQVAKVIKSASEKGLAYSEKHFDALLQFYIESKSTKIFFNVLVFLSFKNKTFQNILTSHPASSSNPWLVSLINEFKNGRIASCPFCRTIDTNNFSIDAKASINKNDYLEKLDITGYGHDVLKCKECHQFYEYSVEEEWDIGPREIVTFNKINPAEVLIYKDIKYKDDFLTQYQTYLSLAKSNSYCSEEYIAVYSQEFITKEIQRTKKWDELFVHLYSLHPKALSYISTYLFFESNEFKKIIINTEELIKIITFRNNSEEESLYKLLTLNYCLNDDLAQIQRLLKTESTTPLKGVLRALLSGLEHTQPDRTFYFDLIPATEHSNIDIRALAVGILKSAGFYLDDEALHYWHEILKTDHRIKVLSALEFITEACSKKSFRSAYWPELIRLLLVKTYQQAALKLICVLLKKKDIALEPLIDLLVALNKLKTLEDYNLFATIEALLPQYMENNQIQDALISVLTNNKTKFPGYLCKALFEYTKSTGKSIQPYCPSIITAFPFMESYLKDFAIKAIVWSASNASDIQYVQQVMALKNMDANNRIFSAISDISQAQKDIDLFFPVLLYGLCSDITSYNKTASAIIEKQVTNNPNLKSELMKHYQKLKAEHQLLIPTNINRFLQ